MKAPTIHTNGTDKDSLLESHIAVADAIRVAIGTLDAAAPNPRDYYPQGDAAYNVAALEHADRVGRLRSVLAEIEALTEIIAG